MVSMAFTALQVATVKAEEESLDGATQIFSGSEESSEKKKKIEPVAPPNNQIHR